MKPAPEISRDDLIADPFHEKTSHSRRLSFDILGGRFAFASNSKALLALVKLAFAKLPAHSLGRNRPRFNVQLQLSEAEESQAEAGSFGSEPPRLRLHSGLGMIYGIVDASNFAIVSPRERSAMLAVSRRMLDFPYHLRYELIEFAVYTLAVRAMQLVPLHAGCIGRNGRGILLIGDSGGGKSTLSLHALARGLEFIAEDSVLVSPTTMLATGIASYLHLRDDALGFTEARTAARLRRSPIIRRRSGVEKFEIDLRRTGYSLSQSSLQIVGSAVLTKQHAANERNLLRPLSKKELLQHLIASQPYAAGQPGWSEFNRRILQTGGYELRRGHHPDDGVAALESLL
jgi:hypothetical protein